MVSHSLEVFSYFDQLVAKVDNTVNFSTYNGHSFAI